MDTNDLHLLFGPLASFHCFCVLDTEIQSFNGFKTFNFTLFLKTTFLIFMKFTEVNQQAIENLYMNFQVILKLFKNLDISTFSEYSGLLEFYTVQIN